MATIYLETTIPSYLAARPSRDVVVNAHQQITHEWWEFARHRFVIVVSEAVLEEIRAGDAASATRRLELVRDFPILELNDDVRKLAHTYEEILRLPKKARVDLVHIAFAVSYEVDYLLTWNCAHLANGEVIRRLMATNRDLGRPTPLILTPEELSNPIE